MKSFIKKWLFPKKSITVDASLDKGLQTQINIAKKNIDKAIDLAEILSSVVPLSSLEWASNSYDRLLIIERRLYQITLLLDPKHHLYIGDDDILGQQLSDHFFNLHSEVNDIYIKSQIFSGKVF